MRTKIKGALIIAPWIMLLLLWRQGELIKLEEEHIETQLQEQADQLLDYQSKLTEQLERIVELEQTVKDLRIEGYK